MQINPSPNDIIILPIPDNFEEHVHFLGGNGIKIALTYPFILSKIFTKLKDTLTVKEYSNVIYQIPCSECVQTYIGETSRAMYGRIISHRSNINRKLDSCTLAQHALNLRQTISAYYKKLFLEMVHNKLEPNRLSHCSDIEQLSDIRV